MTYKHSQLCRGINQVSLNADDTSTQQLQMHLYEDFRLSLVGECRTHGALHIKGTIAVVIDSTFAHDGGSSDDIQ